ncbi:MAG: helix-turn-helix transcriptional regulator [Bacteroidales bacterium]|nr:helix-turn-helix transcriptional regulator [Bacteroidales bacterium]
MREDGITKLGLFSFSPSSKKEMSFLVITSSGKRWSFDFEARTFQEFNLDLKLTIAEKAILQRARKGMSNEEIADDLYLSLNTDKSHKMHIFKKLNVSNITEALVVIGNYQLL